jgi:hypothetical protein
MRLATTDRRNLPSLSLSTSEDDRCPGTLAPYFKPKGRRRSRSRSRSRSRPRSLDGDLVLWPTLPCAPGGGRVPVRPRDRAWALARSRARARSLLNGLLSVLFPLLLSWLASSSTMKLSSLQECSGENSESVPVPTARVLRRTRPLSTARLMSSRRSVKNTPRAPDTHSISSRGAAQVAGWPWRALGHIWGPGEGWLCNTPGPAGSGCHPQPLQPPAHTQVHTCPTPRAVCVHTWV